MDDTPLRGLRRWYMSRCDGNREHSFWAATETLDHPGWRLLVGLEGAGLEAKPFEEYRESHEAGLRWSAERSAASSKPPAGQRSRTS
jgi:hypothetical protein